MPIRSYLNHNTNLLLVVANFLLVVVTVIYVFLTWRTLKALERASRKDLELRHLEDIKSSVAEPVLGWLEEIFNALGGRPWGNKTLLWIGPEPVPKKEAPVEESPYDYPWEIRPEPTLQEPGAEGVLGSGDGTGGVLQKAIFSDARRRHFRSQISRLETFLRTWQTFLSDLAAFTADCARNLQSEAGLPHVPATGSSLDEFANADYLVESCIRQIIRGTPCHFEFPPAGPRSDLVCVTDRSRQGRSIAQGRNGDRLKAWVAAGSGYVKAQWENNAFSDQVRRLLSETQKVRAEIESIKLTHFLPGDCVYVGGRRSWALPGNWRTWRR